MDEIVAGKYRIVEQLGRGGMGTVYKAIHTSLGREDAIKVLHPELSVDRAFVERFLREARAMARLDHENIVRVYDIFESGGIHCIAMEFFDGFSLRSVLQSKKELKLIEIISIISQAASGLAYAHERGIVHRDVKPGNIIVNRKMEIKIADFGIAAAMDEASLTMTGELVGSPRYMPPEQARSEAITNRSDLYSLGMVFYELLTGLSPFEGDSGVAIIGKLAYEKNEIQLRFPDAVPEKVQYIIRRLLYRDPNKRIEDARTLQNELVEAAGDADIVNVTSTQTVLLKPANSGVLTKLDLTSRKIKTPSPKIGPALLAGISGSVLLIVGTMYFLSGKELDTSARLEQPEPDTVAEIDKRDTSANLRSQVESLQSHLVEHENASRMAQDKFKEMKVSGFAKVTFSQAMKKQIEGSTLLAKAKTSVLRLDYNQAKQTLVLAESYFDEAEKQFLLAYEVAAKNTTFVAVENIVDEALLLQREVLNKKGSAVEAKADTNRIPEFARGIYYQDKADDLFERTRELVKIEDLVKAKVVIDKANVAYATAGEYFDKATLIAKNKVYSSKMEKLHAKLRQLQLDVTNAKFEAERLGAENSASNTFEKAVALNKELSWQTKNIMKLVEADRYRRAVSKLEGAIILANQTKVAYKSAGQQSAIVKKAVTARVETPVVNDIQPTAKDIETVESLIYSLARAYEQKDLQKLKMLANISEKNVGFIQQIFTQYGKIDITVTNYSVVNNLASVDLSIEKLITASGDEVTPGAGWRHTHLLMRKNKNGWEKFSWN